MKLSIIGAGNVATLLGQALVQSGVVIGEIFSRSLVNATALCSSIGGSPIDSVNKLNPNSDLYLIAVSDDAIVDVLGQVKFFDRLLVHTSGTVGIDVFEPFSFEKYGVFYPLQSMNKQLKIDFTEVPFCLEANNDKSLLFLHDIARSLSPKVYHISSAQRETLHLAAVFANNFTNYLYQIAFEITKDNDVPFEILLPLIQATAEKINNNVPADVQTGPAVRHDVKTINEHLIKLENYPQWKELYQVFTNLIEKSTK